MKKFAALMLVLATCVFAATGCGGDDTAADPAPAAGEGDAAN